MADARPAVERRDDRLAPAAVVPDDSLYPDQYALGPVVPPRPPGAARPARGRAW